MEKNVEKLLNKYEKLRNKFENKSRLLFSRELDTLFNEFPNLKKFSFDQYTPYFADGDECIFGVNCDYPSINGIDYWDDEDEFEAIYEKEIQGIRDFIRQFPDSFYLDIFGDHKTIEIHRDGRIEISHCEHE